MKYISAAICVVSLFVLSVGYSAEKVCENLIADGAQVSEQDFIRFKLSQAESLELIEALKGMPGSSLKPNADGDTSWSVTLNENDEIIIAIDKSRVGVRPVSPTDTYVKHLKNLDVYDVNVRNPDDIRQLEKLFVNFRHSGGSFIGESEILISYSTEDGRIVATLTQYKNGEKYFDFILSAGATGN